MHSYRDSRIIKAILVVFFVTLLVYAYFEARGILWGPSITIATSLSATSSPYLELKGTTTYIAELKLNGESVPVTEAGAFDIPFVLSPGYNRIVLDAKDKYGKTAQRVIQIILTSPIAASSSATSTKSAASSTSSYPKSSIPAASTTLMAH